MNYRENRIANINNEVKELHPLLEKLLSKLPNITHLECTHGVNELGADFVLTKKHESLGHSHYVGVIAKVGSVRQDHDALTRQIKECFNVPRYIRNGGEEIFITEAWVITTGNVSNNAKKKIKHSPDLRNVHFIDGKRLEQLVTEYLPVFWQDIDIQTGNYLNELKATTLELDKRLSLFDVAVDNFYIEQDIYEVVDFNYQRQILKRTSKIKRVNIYDEIKQERFLLIEGNPGAGKSKLLRQLISYYTIPENYNTTNLLPIFLAFKELQEKFDNNLTRMIQDKIPSDLFEVLEGKNNYLILVDGLDEQKLSAEDLINVLTSLNNQVSENLSFRLVLTSRYFHGLNKFSNLQNSIAKYQIKPLSLNKTIQFIQKVCTHLDIKTRIIEDLKKSQLFKELPKSPIAAILLARLLNENSEELPSNMTELYAKYSELMLGRWDMKKGLQSQKNYEVLDKVTIIIAEYMITNGLDSIPIENAKEMIEKYLAQRNLNINSDEIFDILINRTDIVIANHQMQVLYFKHRTFAEFFFAKSMHDKNNFKVEQKIFEIYWMNSVFFYLGLRKDCPELIDAITRLPLEELPHRLVKIMNMGNYLLAAYASPYNTIQDGIKQTILDAAQLYLDISSNKDDSPFTSFSQMQLLWLMQMIVRVGYSYNFFKNAIDNITVEIASNDFDNSVYSKDIQPYALFLLNVIHIELGIETSFDNLLKFSKDGLPLDLSYAIKYESSSFPQQSRLMKKQEKNLKKLLKGNQNLANTIDKMHKVPIKSINMDTSK